MEFNNQRFSNSTLHLTITFNTKHSINYGCEITTKSGATVWLLFQSSSFPRAPPNLKNIYYKDTKGKDQRIISHMACFCRTGVKFEQIYFV